MYIFKDLYNEIYCIVCGEKDRESVIFILMDDKNLYDDRGSALITDNETIVFLDPIHDRDKFVNIIKAAVNDKEHFILGKTKMEDTIESIKYSFTTLYLNYNKSFSYISRTEFDESNSVPIIIVIGRNSTEEEILKRYNLIPVKIKLSLSCVDVAEVYGYKSCDKKYFVFSSEIKRFKGYKNIKAIIKIDIWSCRQIDWWDCGYTGMDDPNSIKSYDKYEQNKSVSKITSDMINKMIKNIITTDNTQ